MYPIVLSLVFCFDNISRQLFCMTLIQFPTLYESLLSYLKKVGCIMDVFGSCWKKGLFGLKSNGLTLLNIMLRYWLGSFANEIFRKWSVLGNKKNMFLSPLNQGAFMSCLQGEFTTDKGRSSIFYVLLSSQQFKILCLFLVKLLNSIQTIRKAFLQV